MKYDHPGRPKKCWHQLGGYIKQLEQAERSTRHIREAKRIGKHFIRHIKEKPLDQVTVDDIRSFINQWEPGKTRRYMRSHVSRLLEITGNFCHRSVIWAKDPIDIRPNVHWLTPLQVDQLLALPMDPEEEMISHLAIGLALRRSDIRRVKVKNIDKSNGWISFLSKGKIIRSVPFTPDTPRILERYEEFREEILERVGGEPPEELIIGVYRSKLTGLGDTALDSRITRIRERLPFHFSFHVLRRTWARQAWEFGVKVEVISFILGHRDTKTTLKYIGVEGDHAKDGMKQIYLGRMTRLGNYEKLQSYKIPEAIQ